MNLIERPPKFEIVAGAHVRAYAAAAFEKPCFDFVWHRHPEIEIAYIARGCGVRYVGRSIRPFYEGDLCLIGPDVPHAYGSHSNDRGGAAWIVVQFRPGTWGEPFWALPEMRAIRDLLDASRRGICFAGEETAECVPRLERLAAKKPGDGVAGFIGLLELLAHAKGRRFLNAAPCDLSPPASAPAPALGDRRLSQVLSWVQQFSVEAISQPQAAALVGMSPAAFSRFFRRKTGWAFQRYVNEVRIAQACGLLATTRKSVIEIAGESGFGNLPNFNRRFREIVQTTPREYRLGFGISGGKTGE